MEPEPTAWGDSTARGLAMRRKLASPRARLIVPWLRVGHASLDLVLPGIDVEARGAPAPPGRVPLR